MNQIERGVIAAFNDRATTTQERTQLEQKLRECDEWNRRNAPRSVIGLPGSLMVSGMKGLAPLQLARPSWKLSEPKDLTADLQAMGRESKMPSIEQSGFASTFATFAVNERWRARFLNRLDFDETDFGTVQPTKVWEHPKGRPANFVSMYRDDESFHRLPGGQVIVVALLPADVAKADADEAAFKAATLAWKRTKERGPAPVMVRTTSWWWRAVLCDEVDFDLTNARQVKLLFMRTGINRKQQQRPRKDGRRKPTMVLLASEVFETAWHESDLESARRAALSWAEEIRSEDAGMAYSTDTVRKAISPEVLTDPHTMREREDVDYPDEQHYPLIEGATPAEPESLNATEAYWQSVYDSVE